VIFVEVLDRRSRVTHRVRLDALPATVGRGYGNAVILDDRYVSPEHARLTLADDGQVVVEDLDSTNGLFAEPDGERRTRLVVPPGGVFRVGHTLLRVARGDQVVPPAAPDLAAQARGRPAASPRLLAVALTAALGLSMVTSYLGGYGEPGAAAYLADALSLGAALFAWAGLWALVTRLTSQRFRFWEHVAVATTVLLVVELALLAASVGDLIESGTAWYRAVEVVALVLTLAALLSGHLRVATPLAARRRLAWSLGIAVTFVGLDTFSDLAGRGEVDRSPAFEGAVRPLAGAAATSLDAFLEAAGELQRRVDAQVELHR
jgi:hypothetical protein